MILMPEFTFVKAEGRSYEQAQIPLYIYAYLPEETIVKVEYLLDGEMLAQCTSIPYKYEPVTEYLPMGRHTLTVRIVGSSSTMELNYSLTREERNVTINKK